MPAAEFIEALQLLERLDREGLTRREAERLADLTRDWTAEHHEVVASLLECPMNHLGSAALR